MSDHESRPAAGRSEQFPLSRELVPEEQSERDVSHENSVPGHSQAPDESYAQVVESPNAPGDQALSPTHQALGVPSTLSATDEFRSFFFRRSQSERSPNASTSKTPIRTSRRSSGIPSLASPATPQAPTGRKRSTTTSGWRTLKLAPKLMQLGRHERKPSTEWTLFGQLFEDDTRNNRMTQYYGTQRPVSYSAQPSASTSTQGLPPTFASAPEGLIYTESAVQSPSAEPEMMEPFANVRHPSETSTEYDPGSDSDSSAATDVPYQEKETHWYSWALPTLPVLYRNILKCGIAYFIGSLFTYTPYLSGFISQMTSDTGPARSAHMVATVTVYFNPAKTVGAMIEADGYCLMGLFYAAFVCLGSMSIFKWLDVKPGWEWLAEVLVILWIGIAMSIIAYMKLRMSKPSFNPACSMTAIILFVVIVKEGGIRTLLQVSLIIILGSIVTNLVCYSLWPQTAMANLQTNMTKTLDSFSTLVQMLTETFLLEEPLRRPSMDRLQKSVEAHQASFTSLKKNLDEAKSEWFCGGPSNGGGVKSSDRAYQDAVDSLNRLGQHLNGLRSGTHLQYELAKASQKSNVTMQENGETKDVRTSGWQREDINGKGKPTEREEDILESAARTWGYLVDDLGPPVKALSTTCVTSLKRLREAFLQRRQRPRKGMTSIQPRDFAAITDGIERALFTFESTSNHALLRLYRRSDVSPSPSEDNTLSSDENPVVMGQAHESIFLVYYFIFTLQEFAGEILSLVDAMSRIYMIEHAKMKKGSLWKRIITSPLSCIRSRFKRTSDQRKREKRKKPTLHRRLSILVTPEKPRRQVSFPKVKPHAPNTVQTPSRSGLNWLGRVKQWLWAVGSKLRERNSRYTIKAGMATAVLAAPAFFEATRPIFMEYRGEWALISFFVVISPTIGATNQLGIHRILGTLFGASIAALIYSAFPENPWVLSIFGFFYSLPCFYIIVGKPKYATTGRFVLLTYNLTCLYCYNMRQRDLSVTNVAFHRSVAVIAGVIWAWVVSRFWWPAEARRELGKALGEFCLNMGWLYTRLVASNSYAPELQDDDEEDEQHSPTEETSLLSRRSRSRLSNSIREFMAMELHLQIKLIELQGLLAQTQHEPRLKGPFPVGLYRNILTSLQAILDRLHSMRCVTTREEWFTSVRQDFIMPVNKERREMVGNIILYFSTLASAFRLKAPLPPYLPPAEKSRQALANAIRKLDVVKNRDVKGSRQLLFFAYALTMKAVIQELDYLGKTLQEAFGVIGGSTEAFEALFVSDAGQAV